MYERAFGDSGQIGIRSLRPSDDELETRWQTSPSAKTVLTESVAWLWSTLFFHPPAPVWPDEIWGDPEAIRRWRARQQRIRAEAPQK